MANMYDISGISYQAKRQPEWFTKALFSGKIIDGGYVKILPNVKQSTLINMLDLDGNILQKSQFDCGWNPTAALKLSEQMLNVETYKIQMEDCIEKFETTWLAERMKPGANSIDELPATLEEASMQIIANEVSQNIDRLLFGGTSGNTNEFSGYVEILSGATDTIKLGGDILTPSNVLGELEKVFMAIPKAVLKNKKDIKFFVSESTSRAIRVALTSVSAQVINVAFNISDDMIKYFGIEIVETEGLTDDQIVAASINNLLMGTDLVSDFAQIELGNFAKPNDDMIYVKGRMKVGVGVAYPSETVLYAA